MFPLRATANVDKLCRASIGIFALLSRVNCLESDFYRASALHTVLKARTAATGFNNH